MRSGRKRVVAAMSATEAKGALAAQKRGALIETSSKVSDHVDSRPRRDSLPVCDWSIHLRKC